MSEPVAKAILLCEYALQDRSNRWSLMATFDNVVAQSIPTQIAPFNIFARFVDIPVKGVLTFQVEDCSGMVVWTSGPKIYELHGIQPAKVLETICGVPPIVAMAYGKYRVAVFIGSERVVDTALTVSEAGKNVPA